MLQAMGRANNQVQKQKRKVSCAGYKAQFVEVWNKYNQNVGYVIKMFKCHLNQYVINPMDIICFQAIKTISALSLESLEP